MMQQPLLLTFCVAFMIGSGAVSNLAAKKLFNGDSDSTRVVTKTARYEKCSTDTISPVSKLAEDFIILVNPKNEATNFISFTEDYFRKQSIKLDTTLFSQLNFPGWNNSSVAQKAEIMSKRMLWSRRQADSLHSKNNQGQNLVWIINNTPDKVSVQMQDGSYICILQALTKAGKWQPIQTWRFSGCGNSYFNKTFQPKSASSFVITIPNTGDFQTKLRLKLLGADKFYYSNEFRGKIGSSDFLPALPKDPTGVRPQFEYQLDTFLHLSKF